MKYKRSNNKENQYHEKILLFILFIQSLTISAQTEEGVIPSDTTYFPPGTWWILVEDLGYYEGYVNKVSDECKVINNKVYFRENNELIESQKAFLSKELSGYRLE